MGTPFLAEIRVTSFNFAPRGWALCNGQLLPINQNQALFSILGTTYGGDGRTTFALPDLRGRASLHSGNGHTLGERSGEENHTLVQGEMPAHTHIAGAIKGPGTALVPTNNVWASSTQGDNLYGNTVGTQMNATAIAPVGGSQPHENMQPFLTLNFIIALQGIFPSPN